MAIESHSTDWMELAMKAQFIKQALAADIGILGTGRMGTRLAAMFARAGRSVILGSRDEARAAEVVRKIGVPGIVAGNYRDAAEAQAVLPAVFIRDGLLDILKTYRSSLDNKLLIDINNPFNDDYSDFLTPWDTSGAEELQKAVPNARIVGAFKNVYWAVFDDPLFFDSPSDVFLVGDDPAAKQQFLRLKEGTPFRYLDAGPLINARTIERMTMITGELGRSLGFYPRMNWRLLG
ncbi:NAD(P)-binding domain-containing protein [Aminobacter anthyllidis]|uniref:NADPH-dependent F420 reductase n=1 Tax=Aminobacter anthyllidis TaxID=1035067 RepID=UPI002457161F|nr:NAD(P)-binding domain-containing protein [Aminobacter anthyllidis]MDH4984351.1 NAD(P)-binding domain-containing protein [Aminobacter anthyllidis]